MTTDVASTLNWKWKGDKKSFRHMVIVDFNVTRDLDI
jgi:hypothetical protein